MAGTTGEDVCAFGGDLFDPSEEADERDGVVLFVLHTHTYRDLSVSFPSP
jgi:hypothetical protein